MLGVAVVAAGALPIAAAPTSGIDTALTSTPAALVNTFSGSGMGPVAPGAVSEFPGADVPFGMIQWSPDTWPDRVPGSGYAWGDSHISGFSLTHLSGTGCASYGDVPILPTLGSIGAHPSRAVDTFSHAKEEASPGQYGVTLGPSGIKARLAVTTRTGIGRFQFPPSRSANFLFKVSGSANGVTGAGVSVQGDHTIVGEATSGQFCQTGTDYTVYFAARFDRAFSEHGAWTKTSEQAGANQCEGATCGGYVTFDTTKDPVVTMKVAISFVSVHDAERNMDVEDPGWSIERVQAMATHRWDTLLGRIRVGGGTTTEQRTFYSALYHSLLNPNLVSDVNGDYIGDDGLVHSSRQGQYSNYSEWDIYRSEIELVSLLAPRQASAMVQSLVNDANQGGWLPKWAIVGGDASQMNGDSADPIIAAAYAFGARDFNMADALAAMVKGATQAESSHGLEIERQYLDQYLAQHYVDASSLDLTSIDYSIGGSVTLEYAIDDFAIAQIAQAQGDDALYQSMMQRAHNWQYLFNPATGYIQARGADGSFAPGAAFQTSQLEPGGQQGFEEGNAIQYTWSVPQDLSALAGLMGGDALAVRKLDAFFTKLNAGRDQPFDWAGNEPSLWTPWEFDYFGAPWRTQDVVRQIVTRLYSDEPVDEPGNDDLGALSSWYVWAAIGLYPVTPGSANLALSSPLFSRVDVSLPSGHVLALDAPGDSADDRYIDSVQLHGAAPVIQPACGGSTSRSSSTNWSLPWVPASVLRTGATLDFSLSFEPDRAWGSSPTESPPSFTTGRVPAVGYSVPSGAVSFPAGSQTTVTLGAKGTGADAPAVRWSVNPDPGLSVTPTTGTFAAPPPTSTATRRSTNDCTSPAPRTQVLTLRAAVPGPYLIHVTMETASGDVLAPVVIDVTARG